jgi:hypothetical protein
MKCVHATCGFAFGRTGHPWSGTGLKRISPPPNKKPKEKLTCQSGTPFNTSVLGAAVATMATTAIPQGLEAQLALQLDIQANMSGKFCVMQ